MLNSGTGQQGQAYLHRIQDAHCKGNTGGCGTAGGHGEGGAKFAESARLGWVA